MVTKILKAFTTFGLLYKSSRNFMEPNKKNIYQFYDIAANLTDHQFGGQYYGKKHHDDDRAQVIQRAKQYGCSHLLIAAGNLEDAYHSFQLCSKYENCYATIGVHPCRAKQPFNKQKYKSVDAYFQDIEICLKKISDKVVAIGQCGLDYDRLEWSTKQQQLQVFPYHFDLAQKYKLPMYLHNRNTGDDFYSVVEKNRDRFSTGVVHSFTGTAKQLKKIIDLDLYVGINGCSLKTKENLEVLRQVPLDRIMLQTDSPYCEIRKSHAGADKIKTVFQAKAKQKKQKGYLIKGRNEPCKIVEVLQVVSAQLKIKPQQLAEIAYKNSMKILSK